VNLLNLALKSLNNRRFAVVLTICTIALSIGLLVLVEQLRQDVRQSFYRSVSGTDLIVGARTAPVQLLLYSVFGIGTATNNMSYESFAQLRERPEVDWAVPMSLGDSHRGYRVIGTSAAFFDRYRYGDREALELAQGRPFDELFEVVLGHRVARQLDYSLGDRITLAHGGGNVSLQRHDDHPFEVAGILAPTGTPVDRQLYISLAAHHAIHIGWETGMLRPGAGLDAEAARAEADALQPDSLTAVLLGLKSRTAVFNLQRGVNNYRPEALTGIMPGITLQELWRITGLAEQVLRVVAALVVLAGLLGMLTVLLTTLNERRREMAILRANGARPLQISALLIFEAGLIAAGGIALGVIAAVVVQGLSAGWLLNHYGIFIAPSLPDAALWAVLGAIWLAGLLIALIPAMMAYRRTLADGMQVHN